MLCPGGAPVQAFQLEWPAELYSSAWNSDWFLCETFEAT